MIKELSCDGVTPIGPCSAWPQERHLDLMSRIDVFLPGFGENPVFHENIEQARKSNHAKKVNAGIGRMVTGLAQATKQAIRNGRVTEEIRNERYETCKNCPFFVEDSKRCSECGCFMEAKTWIGGDPDTLCPKQKWSR